MQDRGQNLPQLLKAKNTVFSPEELCILWNETRRPNLYQKLRIYTKNKSIYQIKKGFYAKDQDYKREEFANKLYKPSYLSLNTVLAREGVIFQYDSRIYSVGYLSREIKVDNQGYIYKRIKEVILLNPRGLRFEDGYWGASRERAFLDALYLYKDYYFDNLNSIDWQACFELVEIYSSKALERRLKEYHKKYA